ncbi:hypothetical protein [Xylella fastidiosa]|nr:hypothetical protein [Xylella fastidiosa]RWA45307.1 hypothetical protein XfCFBP8356_00840 [Xylella fastidiosa subsp. sandyi]
MSVSRDRERLGLILFGCVAEAIITSLHGEEGARFVIAQLDVIRSTPVETPVLCRVEGVREAGGLALAWFSKSQAKGESDMKIAPVLYVGVACVCHDKVFVCFLPSTLAQEVNDVPSIVFFA